MSGVRWADFAEPRAMLHWLRCGHMAGSYARPSAYRARKLRLFGCAGARLVWHLLPAECRQAVAVAESLADGTSPPERAAVLRGVATYGILADRGDSPAAACHAATGTGTATRVILATAAARWTACRAA